MRFFDRAALFAEACLEYGLLPTDDSSVCILFKQTTFICTSVVTHIEHINSYRAY